MTVALPKKDSMVCDVKISVVVVKEGPKMVPGVTISQGSVIVRPPLSMKD